jgi:hypothetical protein
MVGNVSGLATDASPPGAFPASPADFTAKAD